MSSRLLETKRFPENYGTDVVDVLLDMSMKPKELKLQVVGSMSLRTQLYAGDYDCIENVDVVSANEGAKLFIDMIKRLSARKQVVIGDIKCGIIEDYNVFPPEIDIADGRITNYNYKKAYDKADELYKKQVINETEYQDVKKLISKMGPSPSPVDFLTETKEFRFGLLRWSPKDIIKGSLEHRGRTVTLAEAIHTPTIAKVDAVALVQNNRYTDFSVIYFFFARGKPLNDVDMNVEKGLKENILYYSKKGNWFKCAKRMFALAKSRKDVETMRVLTELFNSDAGRIYQISGDIGTLLFLLENVDSLSEERIDFELSGFRQRMGNITLPEFLKEEAGVLEELVKLEDMKLNKKKFINKLEDLQELLDVILTGFSTQFLASVSLKPVPASFLP